MESITDDHIERCPLYVKCQNIQLHRDRNQISYQEPGGRELGVTVSGYSVSCSGSEKDL
jgi:hypothetical protein